MRRQVNRQFRRRGLFRPSAIAATVAAVGVLGVLPALASANTLTLRLEPPVPKANEPFNMIASGTVTEVDDSLGEASFRWMDYGYAPAGGPCASTSSLQFPPGTASEQENFRKLGPFDVRHAFAGAEFGRYKACGYMWIEGARGQLPLAAYGFEFTIGGTCAGATKKANKARRQQKKAKKQKEKARREMKKAKKSGNKNRKRKARKQFKRKSTKLKKKNAYLKKKKQQGRALC